MKVSMIYMLTDELPYMLFYICPACERQNSGPVPEVLDKLSCRGCGIELDATQADIQVLSKKLLHEQVEKQADKDAAFDVLR